MGMAHKFQVHPGNVRFSFHRCRSRRRYSLHALACGGVRLPPPWLSLQNFQDGFAPKEAWSWAALSERFGDSMVRVSLSETGR